MDTSDKPECQTAFKLDRVEPLGKYILIECENFEKTAAGLWLPTEGQMKKDDSRDLRQRHRVAAKGPGCADVVKVGDYVRWRGGQQAVIPTGVEGQWLVHEDAVIARVYYKVEDV